MKVEGDIRAIDPVAFVVGTEVTLFDLCGQSSVLLAVPEPVQPVVLVLQILPLT